MTHSPVLLSSRRAPVANLALLPLALLTCAAFAQNAPTAPTIPGAGQLLKQFEPSAAPALPPTPSLSIVPAALTSSGADIAMPIAVKTIELSGNTVFDTATLKALVALAEGTTQTLGQLDALAQRITAYYRSHGHPLASAFVPVQTLAGGVLRISIVEAVYGRVVVDNQSRVGTAQLESFGAALQPGQLVDQVPLDRALLLLRELAGVQVNASARPGTASGTTDLTITAVDAVRTAGAYSVDNQGFHVTGRARAIGSLDINNRLGRGESLSVLGVTAGRGMNYGRLDLQMPVNGLGTRAGLGFGHLQYQLGDVFTPLKAHGTAQVLDGFVQHALVRSMGATLNTDLRLERKVLKDRVDTASKRTDRTVTSVTAGLSGELRDELGGGGASSVSLSYSAGQVAFDDAAALALDQASDGAHTKGRFGRVSLEMARVQSLGGAPALSGATLFASVRAQAANTNLDVAEHLSIAGPQAVRGYAVNSMSGAQGYVATLELRHILADKTRGTWQTKAFFDAGQVSVYKTAFTTLPNSVTMRSVGVGLSWVAPAGWNAQLMLAQPVGAEPAIAATRSTRAWLSVGGKF